MTIATDNVDEELVDNPRKWNLKFIVQFMIVFGFLSTIFDYITFAVLLIVGSGQQEIFQTGWFILSIATELMVMLVIRTRRPFYRSKPSRSLFLSSVVTLIVTLMIPYTVIGEIFTVQPLSLEIMALLGVIVIVYLILNEIVKKVFYRYLEI